MREVEAVCGLDGRALGGNCTTYPVDFALLALSGRDGEGTSECASNLASIVS